MIQIILEQSQKRRVSGFLREPMVYYCCSHCDTFCRVQSTLWPCWESCTIYFRVCWVIFFAISKILMRLFITGWFTRWWPQKQCRQISCYDKSTSVYLDPRVRKYLSHTYPTIEKAQRCKNLVTRYRFNIIFTPFILKAKQIRNEIIVVIGDRAKVATGNVKCNFSKKVDFNTLLLWNPDPVFSGTAFAFISKQIALYNIFL